MFKFFKKDSSKDDGFTTIELVTGIAILAALAYLVLPLIFPSDSKTSEQYIEEDLETVSEILKIRALSAEANNIPISEVYIGNLGVFSSKSQIRHAINIDPSAKTVEYCLRGEYNGKVLYFESGAGLLQTPSGIMDCPGAPVQGNSGNGEGTSTEDAPVEERGTPEDSTNTPSESSNSQQDTADPQSQTVADIVNPGAFCAAADEGKLGISANGDTYVCTISSEDTRLRWRIAE